MLNINNAYVFNDVVLANTSDCVSLEHFLPIMIFYACLITTYVIYVVQVHT